MHLAIANEICKHVQINDIDRFMLGVIMPDAYNRNAANSSNSHLKYTTADGKKKTYKLSWFRKAYANQINTDGLYLGYYLHLIQDIVFRYFVYSLYNWNPHPDGNIERLHNDYMLLNEYIIGKYAIPDSLCVAKNINREPIFDIYPFDIKQLQEDLKEDFESCGNEEVFFFTQKMADEYIKLATEKCIEEIRALKSSTSVVDEIEWAWDNNTTPHKRK